MKVEPFTVDHYRRLRVQPAQIDVAEYFTEDDAVAMEKHPSFAALDDDGNVLGVGGYWEPWPKRAVAWALLAADMRGHFLAVHKAVAKSLAAAGYDRVEITVQEGFAEGHRWALALGFRCETPLGMARYDPAGRSHFLYARTG
jgi:hypothetical protein